MVIKLQRWPQDWSRQDRVTIAIIAHILAATEVIQNADRHRRNLRRLTALSLKPLKHNAP